MPKRLSPREVERFHQRQRTVTSRPRSWRCSGRPKRFARPSCNGFTPASARLTAEQLAAVEALTRGLVNKFLHPPMQALKQAARENDSARVEALCETWSVPADSGASPARPKRKPELPATVHGQIALPQPRSSRQTSVAGAAMNLRIGSRGSQLALWQANHIAALLRGAGPHRRNRDHQDHWRPPAGRDVLPRSVPKGMFTKEIEEALADGRVDLAVHSLKDLPTELPEALRPGSHSARVSTRATSSFRSITPILPRLPQGAKVGTSSQRRRAQLKALRPDIDAVEFRGNVDTRLRKLAEGQVDAILLAAAGLERLGKTEWLRERLDPHGFLSRGRPGIARH